MKANYDPKIPRRARAWRSVRSQVHVELLPEDDWQILADHELKRITLELSTYQLQLENQPGAEDIARAVSALKTARKSIYDSAGEGR